MRPRPLHTVVETPEFRRCVRGLLRADEVKALVDHLATFPDSGDLMVGTGGARKLRWAGRGKGKSGGVRVISFYGGPPVPVFLLTVFGKGEKANLTQAERNELKGVLADLVEAYKAGEKRHGEGR